MSTARRGDAARPPLDVVTARILTPTWLLFLLGLQLANGTTAALPIWLRNLAAQGGAEPIDVLRGIMAAEIIFAGIMLLFGSVARAVAFGMLLILCFSAIASISAAPHDGLGVAVHALILIVAAALLLALRRRTAQHATTTMRTLSPQWRVIGAIVVVATAATVAGRVQIQPAPATPQLRGSAMVDFDLDGWRNMPISHLPIREYAPTLTALTLEGEHFVVFYSPTCGSCHELFATHFSGQDGRSVIAVRIPPPPEATLVPSDQPTEVDCPDCIFTQLRPGPFYLVQPPVVFRVEDGVIRCIATSRDTHACIDP